MLIYLKQSLDKKYFEPIQPNTFRQYKFSFVLPGPFLTNCPTCPFFQLWSNVNAILCVCVSNCVLYETNVGMMGSGKTTIGQILSEVLGYSFFDRFVTRFLLYILL